MVDISSVGFSSDTSGLKPLQAELGATKDKVKELNTELDKTSASSASAGAGIAGLRTAASSTAPIVGSLSDVAKQLGVSVDELKGRIGGTRQGISEFNAAIASASAPLAQHATAVKVAAAAQVEVNAATKETGGIFSGLASMLGFTGGAFTQQAGQAKASAAEHVAHSAATRELREGMHVLAPELNALGMGMANLQQFTYASRAGILAFAGAVSATVVIDLAKADDVIETTRVRLEGLAGVKLGTALHDGLIDLESNVGKVAYSLEPAIEAIVKLQAASKSNVSFAPGFEADTAKAGQLTTALGTLFEQVRMGGASETEATAGINKFFEAAQKAGGVTSAVFKDLQNVAPRAAASIAKALNYDSATKFEAALDKVPLSIQGLIAVLMRMSASTDEVFQKWTKDPQTVAEAVNLLKHSFDELWTSISGGNHFQTSVINVLKSISAEMDNSHKSLLDLANQFDLSAQSHLAWSDIFVRDESKLSGWNVQVGALIIKPLGLINDAAHLLNGGIDVVVSALVGLSGTSISSWADAAIARFQGVMQAALNAAAAIAKAAGAAVSGSGGGVSSAGAMAAGGLPGLDSGTFSTPNTSSSSVDTSGGSSGGMSANDYVSQNFPAFATGGSFTVGGSGGTDSQLIQFMATPGEKVSIDTPSAAGAGAAPKTLGSLIPTNDNTPAAQGDVVSAHLAEDIKTQTTAITDKLGTVKDAVVAAIASLATAFKSVVATTTIATAATGTVATPSTTSTTTATPTTATTPTTSTASTASGGGGISFKTAPATHSPQQQPQVLPPQPQQPTATSAPKKATPTSDYTTSGAVGANGARINPPSTVPVNSNINPNATGAGTSAGANYQAFNATDPFGVNSAGLPGSPFYGPPSPNAPASFADRFNAADPTNGKSADAVKQQTDALKQSQTDSGKTVADAVTNQTTDTKSIGDQTNQSLGSVEQSTQTSLNSLNSGNQLTQAGNAATTSGFDAMGNSLGVVQQASAATTQGVAQTTDAVSTGSGDIVGKLGSVGSEIANAVSGAVSSAPSSAAASSAASSGAVSPSAPSSGISGFGADGSISSAGLGSGSSSGGPSSFDNLSVTAAPTDFASSVAAGTYPAMAIGGQFTVKGAGGTDTQHVEFMASPGETVTVTPPGGTPPPNPSMAGTPSNKSGMMAFATGGQFTLGTAMGEPSLAGADIVAAHLADNTRSQTADLKDKLDQIAAKVINAITAAANSISNTVTAALAQAAASATAAAATTASPTTAASTTTTASTTAAASGIDQRSAAIAAFIATGAPNSAASTFNAGPAKSLSGQTIPGYYMSGAGQAKPLIQYTPGALAEGGTFVVPGGTGGADNVNIGIKATPGERIMVLPPNEAKSFDDLKNTIRVTPESLSKFMPSLQDNIPGGGSGVMSNSVIGGSVSAATVAASAGAPGANRSVNIYVQQGVQADTFIQSRAQIQRVMGR